MEGLGLKGEIRRQDGDPGNEDSFTFEVPRHNSSLDEVRKELLDGQAGPITEPWWIEIPERYDGGPNFQLKSVRWYSRMLEGVEKLDRVLRSKGSIRNCVHRLVDTGG